MTTTWFGSIVNPSSPRTTPGMASAGPDQGSGLVFFTYQGRKVAVVRPTTHAEAVNTVLQYFRPLKDIPPDSITISAQLPDHQAQGSVEIHPQAWQVVLRTTDTFDIGVELDEAPRGVLLNMFRPPSPDLPSWASVGRGGGGVFVPLTSDQSPSADFSVPRGLGRGRGRGPTRIGKPVIYLYPTSPIDASVKISLIPQWKFSALYPIPAKGAIRDGESSHSAEWTVSCSPDGMMKVKGTSIEMAYLFWEAKPITSAKLLESPPTCERPASPDTPHPRPGFIPGITKCSPGDSVLLPVDRIPFYLDEALLSLGLHVEARTSFISYWLPYMLNYKFIALRFVPQVDYEASAPLEISPRPDVVTRVYMLFQGIAQGELDRWEEAQERSLEGVDIWKAIVGVDETRQHNKSLFRVLEWGGMEVF